MAAAAASSAAASEPLRLEVRIENFVYTAQLSTSIDLPSACDELRSFGSEYNPKKFAAVILREQYGVRGGEATDVYQQQLDAVDLGRLRAPSRTSVLIFRIGNLVCTGAKTPGQANYMLNVTAERLRGIGYHNARIKHMRVENIVGRVQFPFRIHQANLAASEPSCTYEPEQFPGVIMRHPDTAPITLLIFNSGKVVVTGAKSKTTADAAVARVAPVIARFAINAERPVQVFAPGENPFARSNISVNRLVGDVLQDVQRQRDRTRAVVQDRRRMEEAAAAEFVAKEEEKHIDAIAAAAAAADAAAQEGGVIEEEVLAEGTV